MILTPFDDVYPFYDNNDYVVSDYQDSDDEPDGNFEEWDDSSPRSGFDDYEFDVDLAMEFGLFSGESP
jgi:hypothetical protein